MDAFRLFFLHGFDMTLAMQMLHVLLGLVLLAEGLNKLERSDPLARGLTARERTAEFLRAGGWFCITLGSAGLLVAAWVPASWVHAGYLVIVTGSACLVVRGRVREPLQRASFPNWPPIEEFDRTVKLDLERRP